MDPKKPLPIWSIALSITFALGLVAAIFLLNNPTLDRDALVRARTKPGASPAAAGQYGMPKGSPIIHNSGEVVGGSRQKPAGR